MLSTRLAATQRNPFPMEGSCLEGGVCVHISAFTVCASVCVCTQVPVCVCAWEHAPLCACVPCRGIRHTWTPCGASVWCRVWQCFCAVDAGAEPGRSRHTAEYQEWGGHVGTRWAALMVESVPHLL